jgi:hypothetical protein
LAVDGTPSALSSRRTVGVVCRSAVPISLLVGQDERHTATLGGCLEDLVNHARSDRRLLKELGKLGDLGGAEALSHASSISPVGVAVIRWG